MNTDLLPLLSYLGTTKKKGKEINVELCPFCNGGEKRDKWTFSVNEENGCFKCLRGKCGVSGNLFQLKQHFGLAVTYSKPNVKLDPPTAIEQYWIDRQISKKTLQMLKVGEKDGATAFPYFMNGEIVLMKYRKQMPEGKNCWQEPNGMPVLWNMDNIDCDKPVIMTEGEPDAMSVYQSGKTNVVSVPFGTNNLTWLETCKEWLAYCHVFILYLDNDSAGKGLQNILLDRLGWGRCKIVTHELKDANEELIRFGSDYVFNVIEKSHYLDSGDVEYFSDIEEDTQSETVKTGFDSLDRSLQEFALGEVTVWTGRTSSGKSTIINQSILKAVESGYKCFIYSGELANKKIKKWIIRTAAGKDNLTQNGYDFMCKTGVQDKIVSWLDTSLIFYSRKVTHDNIGKNEIDSLLKIMEFVYHRDGCRIFLIDNIMTATIGGLNAQDFYQQQVIFMGRLLSFADKFNCHVHVVIHQGKSRDSGTENVSGMAQLTQLVHNALMVVRPDKENVSPKGAFNECICFEDGSPEDGRIEVLKCRESGSRKKILLKFEPQSKRFYGLTDRPDYQYPWKDVEVQDVRKRQANDLPSIFEIEGELL